MRTRRNFLRLGLAIGALLTCTPLLGLLGTMIGMSRAFTVLGGSGISDPHKLSSIIAGTMLITAGGFMLFPAGIVLLIVCGLLLQRMRRSGPPPLPRYPENFVRPLEKD